MITVKNLHKAFGPKVIYAGFNLEIPKGETHVIIGRSGEGKSVLLKHLCGLLRPDKGRIEIAGERLRLDDPASVSFARSKVSMVFQAAALFDSLNVRRNVGFYLDEEGRLPRAEIDARVERLLREVNLPNTGHLFPSELSGGMKKRVGLARALAMQPEIVLYDEPTTGLDPVTSDVINDLILATRERYGVTAIVVTHDMKSALKVGDRISMLYEGRLIFTGTPSELQNSEDPYVHQFVNGHSEGPITRKDQERVSTQVAVRESQIMNKKIGTPAP